MVVNTSSLGPVASASASSDCIAGDSPPRTANTACKNADNSAISSPGYSVRDSKPTIVTTAGPIARTSSAAPRSFCPSLSTKPEAYNSSCPSQHTSALFSVVL